MRDAAGEGTDVLHLLGVSQRLAQVVAFLLGGTRSANVTTDREDPRTLRSRE